MKEDKKISELLKQRGGYITAKEAREEGIENKYLQRLVMSGELERVAHGLYVREDVFPEVFFLAQYRCPKGVFSHETALFLHGLSDRVPLKMMMTIPSGWNTQLLKDENYVFFYCGPEKMDLGISEIETPSGVKVKTYDVERTLCDCLRHIKKLDRDLVLAALKQYSGSAEKDSAKLLRYASIFNIRDIVFRYMEVLT